MEVGLLAVMLLKDPRLSVSISLSRKSTRRGKKRFLTIAIEAMVGSNREVSRARREKERSE